MDRYGPYVLIERLASGGLGEVYRAKRVGAAGFEKQVALKFVRPELAQSAERIQSLIDEAKLSARLTHGNIAQTLDLLQAGDHWLVVQELVDGVNVRQLSQTLSQHERRLGLEECVYIVKEVLLALDFVHRLPGDDGQPLGVMHCDIAPANIMVTMSGEVKLIDFGTARGSSLADIEGRFSGGKVRYRAPEQIRSEGFDLRADLYSVGVVLWELFAGERIYESMGFDDIIASVGAGAIPSIKSIRQDLPGSLVAILERAIHPDPRLRYPQAASFSRALEDQPIGRDVSRSCRVLAEIAQAVRLAGEPASPAPQLVSLAEGDNLEASLLDALDG